MKKPGLLEITANAPAHSAQIWRIFLPVYHRPSKMPGFLIWLYAILGRIVVPEMRFPGISLGNFFLDHVALEIAVRTVIIYSRQNWFL